MFLKRTFGSAFALALTVASVARAAAPTDLQIASAALVADEHCAEFKWSPSPQSSRGAILVPAEVNGTRVDLQLDTGADASIVYGTWADEMKWSSSRERRFIPRSFVVANTSVVGGFIYVARGMQSNSPRGTLGLAELSGRIAVIDYPARRFCLFKPAEVPASVIAGVIFAHAILRNGKLFLPVSSSTMESSDVIFDTGSSETALNVSLDDWRKTTGLVDPRAAPVKSHGTAWGKPFVMDGAPPKIEDTHIGPIRIKLDTIVTRDGTENQFADEPFKVSGIMGNAPFWDGIVVLDLTSYARFGVIH